MKGHILGQCLSVADAATSLLWGEHRFPSTCFLMTVHICLVFTGRPQGDAFVCLFILHEGCNPVLCFVTGIL